MVNFCGEFKNSTRVTKEGVLANECFVDGLGFVAHIAFVLIAIPILIAINKAQLGSREQTWVHFPGHNVRWLVTCTLMLVSLLEIGEGIISDSLYAGVHLHLYVPHMVSGIATSIAITFYHHIEKWNSPRFLLFLSFYWWSSLVVEVFKLINLNIENVAYDRMRYALSYVVISFYLVLLLLELYVLLRLKYAFFKHPRKLHPPKELIGTELIYSYANLLSKVTFIWVRKMLTLGYNTQLEMQHLGLLPKLEMSYTNYTRFKKVYDEQKEKNKGQSQMRVSIWKAYLGTFWRMLLMTGLFRLLGDLMGFVPPIALEYILRYIEDKAPVWKSKDYIENYTVNSTVQQPRERQYVTEQDFFGNAFILSLFILLALLLQSAFLQAHYYLITRQGIRLRSAVQGLVYEKLLRLSRWNYTSGKMTYGETISHMTMDPYHLMMTVFMIHQFWALPLRVGIALVLLYWKLGFSAIVGGLFILILCPIQYKLAQVYTNIQIEVMAQSEKRMAKANEMLQGIRLLKLYGWEILFGNKVKELRRNQIGLLVKATCMACLLKTITIGAPIVASCLAFGLYPQMKLTQLRLRPGRAFCSFLLVDILSQPLHIFPLLINLFINAKLSSNSLMEYLSAPEIDRQRVEYSFKMSTTPHPSPMLERKQMHENSDPKKHRHERGRHNSEDHHNSNSEDHRQRHHSVDQRHRHHSVDQRHRHHSVDQRHRHHSQEHHRSQEHRQPKEHKSRHTLAAPTKRHRDRSPSPGPGRRSRDSGIQTRVEKGGHRSRAENGHWAPKNKEKRGSLLSNKVSNVEVSIELQPLDSDRSSSPSASVRSGGAVAIPLAVPANLPPLIVNTTIKKIHAGEPGTPPIITTTTCEEDDPAILPGRGVGFDIHLTEASFSWDPKSAEPLLKDINLQIDSGKLTMVLGGVGAGKSSLLSALLGEMHKRQGAVLWKGGATVSFVPQEPWILNATVEENILFGLPKDEKRYQRVIQSCSLQPEFDILPMGDRTEIGDTSINLSAGQQQRISLARAMYSHADVIVMDDPFSSLDLHAGGHVFQEGILNFLLRRKRTVILTTYETQYVPFAHLIVYMENGQIKHQGSLEGMKQAIPAIYATWEEAVFRAKRESQKKDEEVDKCSTAVERWQLQHKVSTHEFQRQWSQISVKTINPVERLVPQTPKEHYVMTSPRQAFFARQVTEVSVADTLRVDSTRYERSLSYISEVLSGDDVDQKAADADEKDEEQEDLLVPESECSPMQPKEVNKLIVGKLLVDEDRVIRPVSPSSYLKYAQLASLSLVFFLILLHILRMGCIAFADIWLALWTDRALPSGGLTAYIANDTFLEPLEVSGYVRGYFSSTSMALVMTIIVIFASELIGLRAAGKLHKTLLNSIMHAPLRFFDNTPIGSIMNKFAGDTYLIDDRLSASFEGLLRVLLFCIATLVFNIAVNPYFVVPAIPIILVYYGLETFFRKSSRELHRLDSLTKSPIVALFMETLAGLRTIRAFRDESRFLHLMLTKIDGNTHAFLWLQAANRWLGVRYDVIGALTVFMSCICSISAALAYHVGAGIVGLAISYSVLFASCLTWLVRWVTETETQMNAVERVLNFCKIQQEQLSSIDSIEVPPSWPTQGRIQYSMVSLRYAENLEPVVREISFTIEAGQKVAICGSKGSGKTSITLGLFRTLDIVEGVILVDNVDISKVPVLVLRSHIGIIPQDPTLFVGTIRFNLDPEEKKSDSELWQALEVAHLKSMVEGMPKGLDTHIDDGAESFKPAERQLFGLARVCLRDLQIIVMDEATTSVDMYMDDIVREAVRTIFKDKTVITIAHRISTITDFDTIIAVDQGKLIEMDTPQNLLNKPDSFIAKLMKDHTNSTSA